MDRNSAIGLTLMAFLLLGYFYFFSPTPEPQKPSQTTSASSAIKDSTTQNDAKPLIDSTVNRQYGDVGSFLTGKEEFTSVENDVLKLVFSSHGTLAEVNLKNYKTYSQQPLFLAKDGSNKFSLMATHEGRLIDLYQLHYQSETSKQGDTTRISFIPKLSENAFIKNA